VELKFTKQNLVLLLLVVCHRRTDGHFLSLLLATLEKSLKASGNRSARPVPVRATWYNYFKDFEHAFPDGLPGDDLGRACDEFVRQHPAIAEKFYRSFSPETFSGMRDFLISRGYLDQKSLAEQFSGINNSLYFSLVNFIGPRASVDDDHITLPGTYRIYRPSLSVPEHVLVSAARITSNADGSLHYLEKMHFRVEYGWREQYLDGYIIGVDGRGFLLTKDDNSRLLQLSILKPLERRSFPDGTSRLTKLAGSYTGASAIRPNGLFSTGMVMIRDRLEKLDRYPVRRWKIGLLGPFGLQPRELIPKSVLLHLYE
jgi:hypothetical protein